MERLPEDLKPENVKKPSKGCKNSPLSNHHIATQKIDGETYNCNEQYYKQQKALTFSDTITAEQVMEIADPKTQKKVCKKFDKLDQKAWDIKRLNTMRIGLHAKFTQNANLKDFLGTTTIQECNRRDSFWGIGMSLGNPSIWKYPHVWLGKANNQLGSLLMDLRLELKQA